MDNFSTAYEWVRRRLMALIGQGNGSPGNETSVTPEEQPSQTPKAGSISGQLPESGDSAKVKENNIPLIGIYVQVLVTGQTFGAEQQFINRINQHLKDSGIQMRRENYERNSDRLLLLFCPVVSRVGTDIGNALEDILAGRKIILIVMHHIPNENLPLHTDSRGQIQSSRVLWSVDCRFSQTSGLYSSEMNAEAVRSASSMIQKQKHLQSAQIVPAPGAE